MADRRATGRRGEALAARYLEQQGYQLVERNYRCAAGEIDLVVQTGDALVFVEVRTRRSVALGTPEESITPAKAQRLIALAWTYLQERQATEAAEATEVAWRIDVIAIELDRRGRVRRLNHVPYAVEA